MNSPFYTPPGVIVAGALNHRSQYVSVATQTVTTEYGPILARACIVDYHGVVLIDLLSYPTAPVTDFHTEITGLRREHFLPSDHVSDFDNIRMLCATYMSGRIIVGYELWYSLDALRLSHPTIMTRDLATYFPLMTTPRNDFSDFRLVIYQYMRRNVRGGLIHPVEDSRAAMDLFRSCERGWEALIGDSVWPCLLPPPSHSACYT